MKTGFRIRNFPLARVHARLLIVALLGSYVAAPAFGAEEVELPSVPNPTLQLKGTLASLQVAPSKLDQGPEQTSAPAPSLQIAILEGEDVSNNIKERTAREPIVQVTDENHKPVAGAVVLFTIESQTGHAGATFANGATSYTGTTDAEGKVAAHGFQPNTHAGQFHVNVTATKGNLHARTVIAQTNIAAATTAATAATIPGFISTHVVLVSLVAAGAVVGGVVTGVVVSGQSSSTTISTGTGTVGAPGIAGGLHGVRR